MSVSLDLGNATKQQLRRALLEAELSLLAIGHPAPIAPADGYVCGVIARGALERMAEALTKETTE